MANYKRDRINEGIKREVADILSTVKDPRIPPIPSIVAADVTGDLEEARIYISFFSEYDEKEVKQGLKAASGYVRKKLAERLNLRAVPKIIFILDHSIENGAKINNILKGLNIDKDAD